MQTQKNQRGVTLILSLLMLALISGISLTLSRVLNGELQGGLRSKNFIEAFYAANSGIERGLYRYRKLGTTSTCTGDSYCSLALTNGGSASIQVLSPGGVNCPVTAPTGCIISIGILEPTQRRIRVTF